MEIKYRHLTDDDKQQICAWKYDGDYEMYNLPAYDEMQAKQIGFMNPKSEKMCLSIRNCIKRAPKSTVPGQHRFGFEKPCFCSL